MSRITNSLIEVLWSQTYSLTRFKSLLLKRIDTDMSFGAAGLPALTVSAGGSAVSAVGTDGSALQRLKSTVGFFDILVLNSHVVGQLCDLHELSQQLADLQCCTSFRFKLGNALA